MDIVEDVMAITTMHKIFLDSFGHIATMTAVHSSTRHVINIKQGMRPPHYDSAKIPLRVAARCLLIC